MLNEHRVLKGKTSDGSDFEMEANWSDHPKIKDSQIIRIRYGDSSFDVSLEDLTKMLMVFGGEGTMKKLLPMKVERIRKMERMLTFEWQAKRDIKRGEKIQIQAPWIDTSVEAEEILSGNVNKKTKFFTRR